jgi:hypothetical protein
MALKKIQSSNPSINNNKKSNMPENKNKRNIVSSINAALADRTNVSLIELKLFSPTYSPHVTISHLNVANSFSHSKTT